MTQIDVALTDYALAIECGIFGGLLLPSRASGPSTHPWFSGFFFFVALAGAAGGTVHGFFSEETSLAYRLLWPATLVLIGMAALAGIHAAASLTFPGRMTRITNLILLLLLGAYCITVVWIWQDFLVAILGYFPAVIFLGVSFLRTYRKQQRSAYRTGFLGVCVTLLAAVVQQTKLSISAQYFNYNALYHVIQAVAFYMVFVAARAAGQVQQDADMASSKLLSSEPHRGMQ